MEKNLSLFSEVYSGKISVNLENDLRVFGKWGRRREDF